MFSCVYIYTPDIVDIFTDVTKLVSLYILRYPWHFFLIELSLILIKKQMLDSLFDNLFDIPPIKSRKFYFIL